MAKKDFDYFNVNNSHDLSERSMPARIIMWLVFAFIIIALIWANFAVLDEVTMANGQVIPTSQTQIIQSLDGGILRDLLVREGNVVNKGQILMHIDATRYQSTYGEGKQKSLALQAKVERLNAEINGVAFKPSDKLVKAGGNNFAQNELALYNSRHSQLQAKIGSMRDISTQKQQELLEMQSKIAQLKTSYDLITQELQMTQPLVKSGAASPVDVLRLQRQQSEIKGELDADTLSIPRLQAAISEANANIQQENDAFRSDALSQLSDAQAQLASTSQANIGLEDRVNRAAIRSPLKGIVSQINIHTVGGVVKPGENVMTIVPLGDSLLIDAKIRPQDVGFLHPGQDAMVKITAYDYAIYGGLKGKLENISADTTTDEKGETFYTIRVRTLKNYLGPANKPLTIIPGMQASVDILTGHKTVLQYMLKPIIKAHEVALRER
jgi:adhesin transport system membrane fusion protein